ncbi:hypothetical protein [Capnocytophaga gingivalis]|jgi:hypothetical protein
MDNSNEHIPGVIKVEGREFLYIADDGEDFFRKKKGSKVKKESLFSKLTSLFFMAKEGGALTENCKIWLPTNELFHGLFYKGDIEGWRKGITLGATHLGLLTAKIAEGNIEVSDGRVYALSDCKVELY